MTGIDIKSYRSPEKEELVLDGIISESSWKNWCVRKIWFRGSQTIECIRIFSGDQGKATIVMEHCC